MLGQFLYFKCFVYCARFVFKIINTVFKITFDFMLKNNIDTAKICCDNKNKFKVYKKCIKEEEKES